MSLKVFSELTSDPKSSPRELPNKDECYYTKYFCEENVWLLVKKIKEKAPEKIKFCYPVFISNEHQHIPLWRQSASNQEDGLVLWDYHVVMVFSEEGKSWVYDFDTQLPFPTEFGEYCEETLKSDDKLQPLYHRLFRVLSAESYLKYFSSDRSHMKNGDGTWRKPPPNYPIISNGEESHNLGQYIAMKDNSKDAHKSRFGSVLNLNNFVNQFSFHKQTNINLDYMYPPEPNYL